jgi:3-dehydrosphinganine reductase
LLVSHEPPLNRRPTHLPQITLVARDPAKLEAASSRVRAAVSSPGTCAVRCVALDVSDDARAQATLGALADAEGVDLLLCCAGIDCARRFDELGERDFKRVMDINFHGTVNCVRAVAPAMRKAGEGMVCLVGSMAGCTGIYGYTAYSASKFALRGFAEALRMELLGDGVRVSLALPPDTDTPQLAAERASMPAATRAMAAAGGEFSAQRVARDIVEGTARGEFFISTGTDGWALKTATAGMAPQPMPLQALAEVLAAPILRIVALVVCADFYGKARKAVREEKAKVVAKGDDGK